MKYDKAKSANPSLVPATPLYDVPRHPKHNQATSEVEVEVVMVSTLYEKFWYLQVYR